MARYSLAVASVAATSAHAFASIHTGANLVASIKEIGLTSETQPLSTAGFAIGVPANTPVATTSTLGLAEDPSRPVSTVNIDTAWSTAPTAPTVFYRRMAQTGIGAGIIWSFPKGLIIPVSSWLVIWNQSGNTGAALDVNVVWDE